MEEISKRKLIANTRFVESNDEKFPTSTPAQSEQVALAHVAIHGTQLLAGVHPRGHATCHRPRQLLHRQHCDPDEEADRLRQADGCLHVLLPRLSATTHPSLLPLLHARSELCDSARALARYGLSRGLVLRSHDLTLQLRHVQAKRFRPDCDRERTVEAASQGCCQWRDQPREEGDFKPQERLSGVQG